MTRVAIVGAGVSGLTCGVELRKRGYNVTLFARETRKTTSAVAAAIWFPYDVSPAEPETAIEWALQSYETFRELARDPATGVSMVEFHVRGDAPPEWTNRIETMQPRVVEDGYTVVVPLIETPVYLPWLAAGLTIERRTIAHFDELAEFDLIVNCAGLGARELCEEWNDLHPGRGVLLKAPYRGARMFTVAATADHLTYILTRGDDILLGGTNDQREDEDVDSEVTEAIYARCAKLLPSLPVQYVTEVGFRPHRSRVLLARSEGSRIIHNTGHGGAGVTVSWACAREVARLAGTEPAAR